MPRLFKENEGYSPLGQDLLEQVRVLLEPLFTELDEDGVPMRELAYLVNEVASMLASNKILEREVKRRKMERMHSLKP